MFLAFSASLRSADLSRQVGAVVAKGDEILATGANDCPKSGGGLYWPELDPLSHEIKDKENGRDISEERTRTRSNSGIEDIIDIIKKTTALEIDKTKLTEKLKKSKIGDLTEYGRVLHAEMEALLSCARNNASTADKSGADAQNHIQWPDVSPALKSLCRVACNPIWAACLSPCVP